jgi:hypothetical protein
VSPRAVRRRDHISWRIPRECENPAGAVRCIRVVGKQTTISNRNTLAPTLLLSEWSPGFVLFYGGSPKPCLPRQVGCQGRLRYADLARSAMLRLLRSSGNTTPARFAHKPFSLHELPSGIRTRGLTGRTSERYIAVDRGGSRRGGLTESRNGPVAGLSPEIVERAVLTFCKVRSMPRSLSVQGWSVSRPVECKKP